MTMFGSSSRQKVWKDRIDTDIGRKVPSILQKFPEARDHSIVEKVAALQLHISEKIEYERRHSDSGSRDIRLPKKCWQLEAGDCVEKSLLTASLFKSVEKVEVRIVGVDNEQQGGGHSLLKVKFPYNPDDVCEVLNGFYRRSPMIDFSTIPSSFRYEHYKSEYLWMIADSGVSCLGDLRGLEKDGYVIKSNGSWDWYQHDCSYEL